MRSLLRQAKQKKGVTVGSPGNKHASLTIYSQTFEHSRVGSVVTLRSDDNIGRYKTVLKGRILNVESVNFLVIPNPSSTLFPVIPKGHNNVPHKILKKK